MNYVLRLSDNGFSRLRFYAEQGARGYLYPIMRVVQWTVDEGALQYGAQLVANGSLPSRDFVEVMGPGSFYWLALCFKLFGVSVGTARTVLLLTAVATVLLVFHLSRRIGASGYFAAAFILVTGVPSMAINSPHYDSNLLALLAFAIFLSAMCRLNEDHGGTASSALLFLAGSLTGLVDCVVQTKGASLAAAFALSLIFLHKRRGINPSLTVFMGWACGFSIQLIWYLYKGALGDLIYANWLVPLSGYSNVNAVFYGFPLWAGSSNGGASSIRGHP